MRDLTHSLGAKDWSLHLSAVQRGMPLFFSFDRWVPLHFEDCLKLEEKFPMFHQKCLVGDLLVHQSPQASSSVPMDQALEHSHNKSAKCKGNVMGITTQKATIGKWSLIKHEKM